MSATRRAVILLLLFAAAGSAFADVFRPAYLELREVDSETWDVTWKVPARNDGARLALALVVPEGAVDIAPRRTTLAGGAHFERRTLRLAGGLEGRPILIDGLAGSATDVIARVERLDGTTQNGHILPDAPQFVVEPAASLRGVAASYFVIGVEHILRGFDHLLFVLALLLLVTGAWRVVATVTAFTLAHSITLAGATLGWVHAPAAPVEATIALSIVFLAREIVVLRRGGTSLAARHPWGVAFAFGLLHGFGFAGALSEVGLPGHAIPLALLCFNLGVEAGQLMFVAAALAAFALIARMPLPATRLAWQVPAYAIGTVATCWTIERIAVFVVA